MRICALSEAGVIYIMTHDYWCGRKWPNASANWATDELPTHFPPFFSTLLSPSVAHQGESGAICFPASISSAPFRLQRLVRRWRWRGDGGSMSGVHTFS